jgi:hypothetical protein
MIADRIAIVPPSVSDALNRGDVWGHEALAAFRRTWPKVVTAIGALCPADGPAVPAYVPEAFSTLDRDLRYLNGLGWTLLDRRHRRLIGELTRSVRALERTRHDGRIGALECQICRDDLQRAQAAIAVVPLVRSGKLGFTRFEFLDRALVTDALLAETFTSVRRGERAFARYRIRAALRCGRFRSAVSLTRDWLGLVFLKQDEPSGQ